MTELVYQEKPSYFESFWAQMFQKQEQKQVRKQMRGPVLTYCNQVVDAPQVEVYYWGPSIKNLQVGHLALRIIEDTDAADVFTSVYISHWPKGQKISFIFDMEEEGRGPDEYLHIPHHMINVKSLKQWWTQFLNAARNGTENYNLLVNNCAQVVYRALRAGYFPHYIVLYKPMITPYGVKEWVKRYRGVTFKKDYHTQL